MNTDHPHDQMLIDWLGGWESHALATYLGVIAGLILGIALCTYGIRRPGDTPKQQQPPPTCKRTTTRQGVRRHDRLT